MVIDSRLDDDYPIKDTWFIAAAGGCCPRLDDGGHWRLRVNGRGVVTITTTHIQSNPECSFSSESAIDLATIKTRGQMRQLCNLLGIELKGDSDAAN